MRAGLGILTLVAALILCAGTVASAEGADAIRDAFGNEFRIGPAPQRIVSLSPNLTEILFAIGVDPHRIAGVTKFCDFPPEVARITKIGGIVDPSVETIVALQPDLIVTTRGNPIEIQKKLRESGLRLFAFDSQDGIVRVRETIETMIRIVSPNDRNRADSTLDAFTEQLARLSAQASAFDEKERPSVYYYDPISPDWTAGPGTHVDEVIRLAGGVNRASDAPTAWPRYALERLVTEPPDWLLVALPDDRELENVLDDLGAQPGWRRLRAVREGRLCSVPADWLMRPGPRVLGAVRQLGSCLHPDRVWE